MTAHVVRPDVRAPRLLAGKRRWTFTALVAVGSGQAAAAVAWSLLVTRLATALGGGAAQWSAIATIPWLLGLAGATGGLVYAERVLAERLGQSWATSVRTALFRCVTATPARTPVPLRSTGATSLRMMGDLSALRRWASLGLAKLAVAVPLLAGCLVGFAVIAPAVAVAAASVLAVGLGTAAALSPWLRRASRVARQRQGRMAAHVVERVGNPQVIQAFGRERKEHAIVARRGRRLADAMVRRARVVGAVRASGEVTTLLTGAVVLYAAAACGTGPGAAAAAIALVGVAAAPVRELARVAEYRSSCAVAMDLIRAELARPRREVADGDAPPLPDGDGEVELSEIYVDGVFAPITARASARSVVAVVGPNGSGKSTLLSAIAGLTRPDAGTVRIDGADIATVRPDSLRRAIGIVGPHLPLLRGSIADNLRYADPDADERRLDEAVQASGLAEILADLPLGLQTRIRERGAGLSAGQQQRVALARALLPRPRLLLLDEADAHLDPDAARTIDRVVAAYRGTVIVVTHRPERLASVDVVWRLADGVLTVEPRARPG